MEVAAASVARSTSASVRRARVSVAGGRRCGCDGVGALAGTVRGFLGRAERVLFGRVLPPDFPPMLPVPLDDPPVSIVWTCRVLQILMC